MRTKKQPHALSPKRRGDFLCKSMHRCVRVENHPIIIQVAKRDRLLHTQRMTLLKRNSSTLTSVCAGPWRQRKRSFTTKRNGALALVQTRIMRDYRTLAFDDQFLSSAKHCSRSNMTLLCGRADPIPQAAHSVSTEPHFQATQIPLVPELSSRHREAAL